MDVSDYFFFLNETDPHYVNVSYILSDNIHTAGAGDVHQGKPTHKYYQAFGYNRTNMI